jgi:hypothetical protein
MGRAHAHPASRSTREGGVTGKHTQWLLRSPARFVIGYACALLAGEVLAVASRGRALVDVQRALVPLELGLLDGAYSGDLSPGTLVRLVAEALGAAEL